MYLAGFRRLQYRYKLLQAPSHFCGFGSATALLLTSRQEYLIRWGIVRNASHAFDLFSEYSAVSVAAFFAVLECFG